ncbi:hypothetical protein ACVQ9Z_04105 [Staphylococcus aureus]
MKAIDSCWLEQVDYLQQLKASVNQRQMGNVTLFLNTIELDYIYLKL